MQEVWALRNNVFFVSFPRKLDLGKDVLFYYNLLYRDFPVTEYILCRAQAIIVYSKDSKFDAGEHSFYRDILVVNDSFLEIFESRPVQILDKLIGRDRLVNPRQFEIIKGSVVRSVIDHRLGAGVVSKIKEGSAVVNFPKAKGYYSSSIVTCHKSNLRVVAHIEEVESGRK